MRCLVDCLGCTGRNPGIAGDKWVHTFTAHPAADSIFPNGGTVGAWREETRILTPLCLAAMDVQCAGLNLDGIKKKNMAVA